MVRVGGIAKISKNILPANTNQAVGIIRLKKKYSNFTLYIRE